MTHCYTSGFVSTHSRLKAAGVTISINPCIYYGFNTQPPEGGWVRAIVIKQIAKVSTHSRLKAAGWFLRAHQVLDKFQHTAA